MADNGHKIKPLRLYEFLHQETDEDHPIGDKIKTLAKPVIF